MADAHALVVTTSIAIAVGILAQVVADRLRLPSIVFLLAFGILVGPDVLGLIDPRSFGTGLRVLVTIAVAIILFEGGLGLHVVDVKKVGRAVRNLITVGALVTLVGAAAAAWLVAGLPLPLALLFGAIVSVTGPTVINPLLDRVRVTRRVDTLLRGEGILIDPIGAILAVVGLELVLTAGASVWDGLASFAARMAIGAVVGLVGGWLLERALRVRRLFPDELENLVVLAWVLALFALSESLAAESGLAAVVLAGMSVRRETLTRRGRLRRFKSELSLLFLSLLFILLSAFLPLATLSSVGWRGVWTVLLLMLVVRPLNVLASTWRTDVTWPERAFLMWISPRGVVAISIASFAALRIQAGGPEVAATGLGPDDGAALLALVFLTISITVVVQGLTAAPIARALGVDAGGGRSVVVVGADRLGRTFARLLGRHGWEPVLVDSNRDHCAAAERDGLRAVAGNVLDRDVLDRAETGEAAAFVAATANQEINLLAARQASEEYGVAEVYPALVDEEEEGPAEDLVEEIGGALAFGRRIDLGAWNEGLRHGRARVVAFTLGEGSDRGPLAALDLGGVGVPLLVLKDGRSEIAHAGTPIGPGDRLVALVRHDALAGGRLGTALVEQPEDAA